MNFTVTMDELAGLAGRDLGASEWIEVTQQRINEFAESTGDHQWMHVDVERAKREMGGTIAHGLLILSLLPILSEKLLRVTGYARGFSYGYDRVRFSNRVPAGSRIRLKQTVKGVEPKKDALLITVSCAIELEGEMRPALVAENLSIYYRN